jgi:predicted AAA+ superfamily ATPase
MNRDLYKKLCEWKADSNRRPLLVRGARQTGKTFLVNEFGSKEFKTFITLNFDRNPEYKEIFSTRGPKEIIERIMLYTGKKPAIGNTLLFIDEIQECPDAIVSLRYFYEEMPDMHIIGAGSLLEFTLHSENFRMPVGRIQYLFLYPLSFGEFLEALGEIALREHLLNFANIAKLEETLHKKLNEYLRKYFLLGGMPAVLKEYISSGDFFKCKKIQRSIIDTYLDDFSKYSKKIKHPYLRKLLESVPKMIGNKFVYARVDDSIKSRELKEAFEMLEMAGLVYRVKRTSGDGIPLEANAADNYFKALFLDIGLIHAITNFYEETIKDTDFNAVFRGSVAEQFAGQELIACQEPLTRPALYYWTREGKSSNAEIDYLIQRGNELIPVEIKSGSTGYLKSLLLFIETYHIDKGYKICLAPFKDGIPVITLPLYSIESFMKNKKV